LLYSGYKKEKMDSIESVENIAELFVEKLRDNAPIITVRSHPRQQEKNQVIIFIFFRGL
jgi:hypothetical protein